MTQATDALFIAKGSVDKLNEPMDENDFERFVRWFQDNKLSLRLIERNFMNSKYYNTSVPKLKLTYVSWFESPRNLL